MKIARSVERTRASLFLFWAWVLVLGLGLATAAGAAEQSEGGWKILMKTGFEFQGETDLDDGGEFEFWGVGVATDFSRAMGEKWRISLKGDYRVIGYDFSGLGGLDPWETVHVFRLNPTLTYLLNERWFLLGGPIGEFAGENGADFGDALRGGGLAGVGYRPSDRFSIVLGALVISEIEDDAYVQPLVLVNWGITEGLGLSMVGDTSRGGEVRLGYTFAERFLIAVGAGFRRERFRLDHRPEFREDGVGEETATIVTGTIGYAFSERARLELYGGTTVDGEFRMEDEDGDKIAKSDYDDGGFGGIRLSFAF